MVFKSSFLKILEECDVLRKPLLLVEAIVLSLPVPLLVRHFMGASIMRKALKPTWVCHTGLLKGLVARPIGHSQITCIRPVLLDRLA